MKTSQGSDSTKLPNEVLQWCGVRERQFSKEIKVKVKTGKPDNHMRVHFLLNASMSQVSEAQVVKVKDAYHMELAEIRARNRGRDPR